MSEPETTAAKTPGLLYGHHMASLAKFRDEFFPGRPLEWVAGYHDGLAQDRSKRDQGDADYDTGWYRGYVSGCTHVAEASGTGVPESNREYWDHVAGTDVEHRTVAAASEPEAATKKTDAQIAFEAMLAAGADLSVSWRNALEGLLQNWRAAVEAITAPLHARIAELESTLEDTQAAAALEDERNHLERERFAALRELAAVKDRADGLADALDELLTLAKEARPAMHGSPPSGDTSRAVGDPIAWNINPEDVRAVITRVLPPGRDRRGGRED